MSLRNSFAPAAWIAVLAVGIDPLMALIADDTHLLSIFEHFFYFSAFGREGACAPCGPAALFSGRPLAKAKYPGLDCEGQKE